MSRVKQMMTAVRMAQNPQLAMQQMIRSNPQMQKVIDFVNTSGKTPEQAFYALAEQMGVDPQEVLNGLK